MIVRGWMWVVLGVALGLLAGAWRSSKFEQRAKAAEAFNAAAQRQVDSLRVEAAWFETAAAKTDTIVVHARATVAHIDSIHPPDTACAPNIKARDAVIQAQATEIDQLKAANARMGKALVLLQGANDTLSAALSARPGFLARHVHGPTVGPAVWLFPGELRVGVSLQVFGLSL